MSKFKTKREYEEEDTLNYLRRLENIQKRKEEKRAQGYDCTFEGCKEHFDNTFDLQEHIKKHQLECKKDMICYKPQCKDLKVKMDPVLVLCEDSQIRLYMNQNLHNDLVNQYSNLLYHYMFSFEVEENTTGTLRSTSRI